MDHLKHAFLKALENNFIVLHLFCHFLLKNWFKNLQHSWLVSLVLLFRVLRDMLSLHRHGSRDSKFDIRAYIFFIYCARIVFYLREVTVKVATISCIHIKVRSFKTCLFLTGFGHKLTLLNSQVLRMTRRRHNHRCLRSLWSLSITCFHRFIDPVSRTSVLLACVWWAPAREIVNRAYPVNVHVWVWIYLIKCLIVKIELFIIESNLSRGHQIAFIHIWDKNFSCSLYSCCCSSLFFLPLAHHTREKIGNFWLDALHKTAPRCLTLNIIVGEFHHNWLSVMRNSESFLARLHSLSLRHKRSAWKHVMRLLLWGLRLLLWHT